jgi:hypothetical protein
MSANRLGLHGFEACKAGTLRLICAQVNAYRDLSPLVGSHFQKRIVDPRFSHFCEKILEVGSALGDQNLCLILCTRRVNLSVPVLLLKRSRHDVA